MELQPYLRKAHYYETDQMGIIHHSNYIRWFEEARVDLMEQAGYGYAVMEADGVSSPVLEIACTYKAMVHFGDIVQITAAITSFSGAKMTIHYRVENAETGVLCTTGHSKHCFLNREGKAISMKRENPAVYQVFCSLIRPEAKDGQA